MSENLLFIGIIRPGYLRLSLFANSNANGSRSDAYTIEFGLACNIFSV